MTRDASEVRQALVSDRERIARDLHAGTIRLLFGIGLHLQAVAGRTDSGVAAELRDCVDDLDRAISELRRYVFGLTPSPEPLEPEDEE